MSTERYCHERLALEAIADRLHGSMVSIGHDIGVIVAEAINKPPTPSAAAPVAQAAPTSDALRDVLAERVRQDKQWGGPWHDDGHLPSDWLNYIERQHVNARWVESPTHPHHALFRQRLVKIAALAVAAIESTDRRAARAQDRESGNGR